MAAEYNAKFSETHFKGNPEHLAKLKEGIESWNRWLKEQSDEFKPDLRGAGLGWANLQGAFLTRADLRGATLHRANLMGANLSGAILSSADLSGAHLMSANLSSANLSSANLSGAHLMSANLSSAKPYKANLSSANLSGAKLFNAFLLGADLSGADLSDADLSGADLQEAFFDAGTRLDGVVLSDGKSGSVWVADLSWGGVNLAVVDWTQVKVLGDELKAQQLKTLNGEMKTKSQRMEDYREAVRANRQLAVVLRNQGLNEEADYFAYRAQVLQRRVLWLQMGVWQWIEMVKDWVQQSEAWKLIIGLWLKIQQTGVGKLLQKLELLIYKFGVRIQKSATFLFSLFLDLLAGYGYKPGRTLIWYLLVIGGFATAYALFGHLPLLPDALVFSFMSFHGRGFFPRLSGETNLHNPLVMLAAAEAVTGLFIEISFIATFTQRFFGR
jgi:uncharacterized protein YjbI with pentapeptide repeats